MARQRAGLWTPTNRVRKCSHRISGRPVGDQLFFRRVLARLQNPELQAVADLRRHAAALQRAHPFRPLIQLAAGRSATNVDWSITWLPARRRDGFGLRSCRARRRARTRLPRRCSIGPRFLLRKNPRGNGATRAVRRETARSSHRLSHGRKANSRGMLFEIISIETISVRM